MQCIHFTHHGTAEICRRRRRGARRSLARPELNPRRIPKLPFVLSNLPLTAVISMVQAVPDVETRAPCRSHTCDPDDSYWGSADRFDKWQGPAAINRTYAVASSQNPIVDFSRCLAVIGKLCSAEHNLRRVESTVFTSRSTLIELTKAADSKQSFRLLTTMYTNILYIFWVSHDFNSTSIYS